MSTDSDSTARRQEDEMLPDEREAIAKRIEALDDDESKLSIEAVAESLGIDLEYGPSVAQAPSTLKFLPQA